MTKRPSAINRVEEAYYIVHYLGNIYYKNTLINIVGICIDLGGI